MSQQEHPQIPQRPPPNVRTQQQNVPPRYQPELQIHQHQYRQQFLVGTSMFGINLLEMQHIFTTVFATITYTPLSLWLAMAFAIGGLITCVPAVICWFGLLICAVIGTGISLFIVFIGLFFFIPAMLGALLISSWITLIWCGYKIFASQF